MIKRLAVAALLCLAAFTGARADTFVNPLIIGGTLNGSRALGSFAIPGGTAFPSGTCGTEQLFARTDQLKVYVCVAGSWVNIGSGGTGSVTTVNTGSGLTGGPITVTGTINLANRAAVSNEYVTGVAGNVLISARPACANLSDAAASCATNALNASNISSGTLPAARLPTPAASTLGGVNSLAVVSHQFLTGIGTDGSVTQAQPTTADISGLVDFGTLNLWAPVYVSATGGSPQVSSPTAFTGAQINSVSGAPAAYGGGSCTNQFIRSLNASIAPSCASVANADLSNSTVTIGSTSVALGATAATINGLTLGTSTALGTPASATLTNAIGLPIGTGVSGLGTGVATALGVAVGSAGAPVVNGGALGTPSSGTLTNATGLPVGGVTGLGTGVATALAVNTGSAGAVVVNGGALGTPSSGTLTSATGLPVASGISGFGTGIATALAVNTGSAGAPVINGDALGTPSSGTLTNATGLPIGTGVSGLGSGVATFLATPSSANLASALTDETGSGAAVFGTAPTITGPVFSTVTYLTGTETVAASATLTQGQGALSASVFESLLTNANNPGAVTLPTAVAGLRKLVRNTATATNRQVRVFPASGDDVGNGANTFMTLQPNSSIVYVAKGNSPAVWYPEGQVLAAQSANSVNVTANADGTSSVALAAILAPSTGYNNANALLRATNATVSTLCTSPAITANGANAGIITVGSSCSGVQQGTLTLPTATTGWACQFTSMGAPGTRAIRQVGGSTTTALFSDYAQTTGLIEDFTAADTIRFQCMGY